MKIIEKKCAMCGSPIYVYERNAREEMYCTLHCMGRAICENTSRGSIPVKSSF